MSEDLSYRGWTVFHATAVGVLAILGLFNGFAVIALVIYIATMLGWALDLFRGRGRRTQRRAALVQQYEDEAWAAEQVRLRRNP